MSLRVLPIALLLTLAATVAAPGQAIMLPRQSNAAWLTGTWSPDTVGADLTYGYQRDLEPGNVLGIANPTPADLTEAQRILDLQKGLVTGDLLAKTPFNAGAASMSAQVLQATLYVGEGWFYGYDRMPGTTGGSWRPGIPDFFTIHTEPVQVGTLPCTASFTANALTGEVTGTATTGVTITATIAPDAKDRAPDPSVGDTGHRNEYLTVTLFAPVSSGCTYNLALSWSLRTVFEMDVNDVPAVTNTAFDVQTYQFHVARGSTANPEWIDTAPWSDSVSVLVLFAPAVQILWTCPWAQHSDLACTTQGMNDTPATGTRTSVFRDDANLGYHVLTTERVNGLPAGERHYLPDNGAISATDSRLVTQDSSGAITIGAW